MSQKLILEKLSWFLEIRNPTDKEIQSLADFIKTKGFCFSFALCHAAMDEIANKLDWWESALIAIATCKKDKNELSKPILLPNSQNNQPISLGEIFTRVLNYILFNQADSEIKHFIPSDLDQDNLLEKYFDFVEQNQIKTIKQQITIAGYFDEDDLDKLLEANNIEGSICFIRGNNHAIRIGYRSNNWILYEPNYSHTSKTEIHKLFTNKNELLKEINNRIGNSLAITLASCDETKKLNFPSYDDILKNKTKDILRQFGLHQIVYYTPHILPRLLELVLEDQDAQLSFATALSNRDQYGVSGLYQIASKAPELMGQSLQIVMEAKEALQNIANILHTTSKDDWSGLQLIARYASNSLKQALKLTDQENIAGMLASKNKEGWTGLLMVAAYATSCLPLVLKIACKNKMERFTTSIALEHNLNGVTGLHALALCSPNTLLKTLQSLEQDDICPIALANAFITKDKEGMTGIDIIAKYAPAALPIAKTLAAKANCPIKDVDSEPSKQLTQFNNGLGLFTKSDDKPFAINENKVLENRTCVLKL